MNAAIKQPHWNDPARIDIEALASTEDGGSIIDGLFALADPEANKDRGSPDPATARMLEKKLADHIRARLGGGREPAG